ncbi:MAG: hypothetical protein WDN29_02505 [Methylovirgula sp.]
MAAAFTAAEEASMVAGDAGRAAGAIGTVVADVGPAVVAIGVAAVDIGAAVAGTAAVAGAGAQRLLARRWSCGCRRCGSQFLLPAAKCLNGYQYVPQWVRVC